MSVHALNDLLEKPFRCFTKEEQLEIVRRGRFTDLEELSHNDKGKRRTFWTSWYQKVKWLSGDVVNKKLFCWPCVLFPTETNKTWSKVGFHDLRNLSQATKKHEESREHVYATIKLRLLSKKNEKKVDNTSNSQKYVEVKRNREYLERLIDIASTLARVEVPFRREHNKESPYGSVVQLMKKYDNITRSQLEQGHSFSGLTPTIQINLVHAMEQAIHQKILEEASQARFFSLIVNEMTSTTEVKRISLSIRYVKHGAPVERFIGLFDVGHGTKAEEVAAILDRELEKFNYKEKMITQSYDGKVVKATELYSLQQAVKRQQQVHCQAQLTHYYGHDFRDILAQSLNSIQECKLFFSAIALFCKFFQKLNFQSDISGILFESIPTCITVLKDQYDYVLRILEYTTTDEQYENVPILIVDAVNLFTHLKNPKFMIFVTMFDKFFSFIQKFMNSIKGNPLNARFCRKEINTLMNNLKIYKDKTEFNNLVQNVISTSSGSSSTAANVFALNVRILDSLIHEIEGRFLDIELGDFFELISVKNFTVDNERKKALDGALILSIKENYPKFFDVTKLRSELDLLYSDPSIAGFGECGVEKIREMLKFFYDNDIKDNIPELYKLIELVVTIPSVGEPLEGDLCVLNRICSYGSLDKEEVDEPRSGLALLAIEKDLLVEMGKSNQWYSQVIDNFAKLPATSSIELVYECSSDDYPMHEINVELKSEPELEIKSEPDSMY